MRSSGLTIGALFLIGEFLFVGVAGLAQSHSNMNTGMQLYLKGEFRSALQKFQAAYQANEDPSAACYQLAVCYQRLGDMKSARQYYSFVCQQFPGTRAAEMAQSALTRIDPQLPLPAGVESQSARSTSTLQSDVQIPYQRYRGMMIVNASVNGRNIPMIFDTGAECTLFTTNQLSKRGISFADQKRGGTMIGIGGQTDVATASAIVKLGGISRQLKVYIQDDRSLRLNQGEEAVFDFPLLGEDFYGDSIYEIDDATHTITFKANSGAIARDANAVPFSRDGRNMVVTVKVNGRECDMIFDTGAAIVSFSDKRLSGLGINRPTDSRAAKAVGVGGMRSSYGFELDSMKLGPIEKQNVSCAVDLHGSIEKPLLGASFLEGLKYTVDNKSRVIHFAAR